MLIADSQVHIWGSWEGERNDLALEAARLHPDKFAVMGRLAPQDPSNRARVADWRKQPGMLGMRFTFHNEHNRHFLTDGSADWLWPAAEKAGVRLGDGPRRVRVAPLAAAGRVIASPERAR